MSADNFSLPFARNKHTVPIKRSRTLKPLDKASTPPEKIVSQLIKFRIDGRTINARNIDELYPGLDLLLLRCLRTGDYRQLDNRLRRNLKAEYLLITGKHIRISVCAKTKDILEKLIEMGATLDLQFYEPLYIEELELLCKYGLDINQRLLNYNNQSPLSLLISKNYSIDMLKVLIRHGAQFDLQDNNGQTCLHIACQPTVADSVFEYIINNSPNSCLNIRNQSGGTPVDLVYLSTYEQATLSRMRRLHLLLTRSQSKLTRYGMREPNLFAKKQYKLFDILSCKEFLFKYRLKDIFDPPIRSLARCIFMFYDVLRACEQRHTNLSQQAIQLRLERYLIAMIENGEISLDKLIFRRDSRLNYTSYLTSSSSLSLTPTIELDQLTLNDAENSVINMTHVKTKLAELRMQTLTLKALCRIKIKRQIRTYPNDIVKLDSITNILQAYLTYYNPFIIANVTK